MELLPCISVSSRCRSCHRGMCERVQEEGFVVWGMILQRIERPPQEEEDPKFSGGSPETHVLGCRSSSYQTEVQS